MKGVMLVWGFIWSIFLSAFIYGAVILVPMVLSLIFVGGPGLLVIVLTVIVGLILAVFMVAALVGIFKGWYLSWIWISVANHLAPFLIGVSLIGVAFQSPFPVGMIGLIAGGGLMKLSFVLRDYWNSENIRRHYSVEQYTST